MKRYWLRWLSNVEDHRPVTYPPNQAILGWWCTGYDSKDNGICVGLVQAYSQEQAWIFVSEDWPEMTADSGEEVGIDFPLGDRFPLRDWMKERIEHR